MMSKAEQFRTEAAQRILIKDGPYGTQIQAAGLASEDYGAGTGLPADQKGNNDLVNLTQPQVIRTICDRVAVIDGGRIVEAGRVADVFLHPRHPVTRSMVAQSDALAAASFDPAHVYMKDKLRGTLVRLTYIGDVTYQPILSRIMAGAKVQITILQGEVSSIKDVPFGQLLLELEGSADDIREVFAELDRHQIHHEVLQ